RPLPSFPTRRSSDLLSFWVTGTAGLIMLSGFFVEGGHAAAGWTSYAPLSAVAQYTGVNWGQNLWCISLFVMGIGSMMGSINYIRSEEHTSELQSRGH